MAQAIFMEGERVLCYETDPGKVNKLYRAAVVQVFIFVMEPWWFKISSGGSPAEELPGALPGVGGSLGQVNISIV